MRFELIYDSGDWILDNETGEYMGLDEACTKLNDFEESIFSNHPLLSKIKKGLYHQGAAYAAMSGSGSTLYGLFRSRPECEHFFADYFTFVCQL